MDRPNTHLVDPMPDSPADTEVPCRVDSGTVYVDLVNFVRLIEREASIENHCGEEPNDADAALALVRIQSLIEHHEVEDGWVALGGLRTFSPDWGERLWVDGIDTVCEIWLPGQLPTYSAATPRHRYFPVYLNPTGPLPYGSDQ